MADPRMDELARTLVRYSTRLQPGETVLLRGQDAAKPLLVALYREALLAGALPVLWIEAEETQQLLTRHGNDEQLGFLPGARMAAAEQADAVIVIDAPTNLKHLSQADPQRLVLMNQAVQPFREIVLKKRWCLCQFPTQALAQEAELSLADYEDFLYGATNIDWAATSAEAQRWKRRLEAGREIRVVGPDTELRLDVAGRTWIPADGKHNMPDGEIFTGPVETSVNGHVSYEFPAIYHGREVDGVRLEFRDGVVVDARARKNEEFLVKVLDTDPGARRLGELGIGLNYGIQRFSKSILFDEKIGGTVHLAVGMSYEATGGQVKSSVHWDMIKDLRDGGAIYLDGQLIQKDGRFLD
ncbi:MAG: aminopeptidase [Chloroflexi bacterium]|nr:aminopeptidase [Chloroflexota bacterium]